MGEIPHEIWIHALGAKAGGGLTYLDATLPEWERQTRGTGTRVVVLLPRDPDRAAWRGGVEPYPVPWAARGAFRRLVFDQLVLPAWLRRRPGAALVCSGSFAPLVKPVPTVTLLRNAIYFDPEFLGRERPGRCARLRWAGALIAAGARGCAAVHYPTAAMRRLVEERHPGLGPLGRVSPYGVGERFLTPREEGTARGDSRRFLYVMNYTLQKNLRLVLQALGIARKEGLKVQVLVTSTLEDGPEACAREDRRLIEEHDLVRSGYLVPLGRRFGEELLGTYRSVTACLFTSITESFGHPLVEAMALGKPLICADRPYAREMCGPHALYVHPDRPEELVEAWRRWPRGVPSPPPAAEVARRFSWASHVRSLLQSFAAPDAVSSSPGTLL